MGKKKNKSKKPKKPNSSKSYPFVSVCTPTFNRRPFIQSMIKCFNHQTYPKEHIEWIIIDDGTDKIEELVSHIPQVKYFKYDKKMPLGKKRNIMHDKSKGEIIVYMDDDDYYPPERISHAVQMLQSHPKALCAGSSEIYIWFKHIQKMVQFGPYGPNHATAGTFAFKRKLLDEHSYEDHAALAEEKHFLKGYTVPFVQLDPKKVILVFSHAHNTFDKKKLLENPHPKFVKDTTLTVSDFVKEKDLKNFYMNEIEDLLDNYEPGQPTMKPDVLKQIIEIEERRRKEAEKMANQAQQNKIIIQQPNGAQKILENTQVVEILQKQQEQIKHLVNENNMLKSECQSLANHCKELDESVTIKDSMILNLQSLNNNLIMRVKTTSNNSENITMKVSEPTKSDNMDSLLEEVNQ